MKKECKSWWLTRLRRVIKKCSIKVHVHWIFQSLSTHVIMKFSEFWAHHNFNKLLTTFCRSRQRVLNCQRLSLSILAYFSAYKHSISLGRVGHVYFSYFVKNNILENSVFKKIFVRFFFFFIKYLYERGENLIVLS